MNKFKIKLNTPEEIIDFTNIVLAYHCDIDVIDGSKRVDAKSLMGVCALAQGKEVFVEIITDDIEAICDFSFVIERFKVK